MRKAFSIFVLLGICAVAAFAQPKLEVMLKDDTQDWGEVKPDESPLKAKIKMKNAGDELLKIYNVKPTCGCTTAPLDKDELKPGEIAELDVTLNFNSSMTKVSKSIIVKTNDPDAASKVIRLKAEVLVPITLFPKSTLNIGFFDPNTPTNAVVVLNNESDQPIKMVDVHANLPSLKCDVKPGTVIPPKESLTANFTIVAEYPGSYSGTVTFVTDSPDMSRVNVHIFGNVRRTAEGGGE